METQSGINYGDFLHFCGFKSPKEFGDLDPEDQAMWFGWYNAKMSKGRR
jgi:hypothetical protein